MILSVAGVMIVVARDELLPANFFYDGITIQNVALGLRSADGSFEIVASIYRFFGLENSPLLAGLLGYAAALLVIFIVVARWGKGVPHGFAEILVTSAAALASAIYLGFYSKDVFVLVIVTLVVVLAPERKLGGGIVVLALAAYAIGFRTYFWVVLGIYLAFRLIVRNRWTVLRWVSMVALFSTLLALALIATYGGAADHFRTVVNEQRAVTTQIEPFVDLPQPIGGVVNNLITAVMLIVPLPLAASGGLYLLVSAGVAFLWAAFFVSLGRGSTQSVTAARAIAMLGAMVATQSAFEPDYGSALRHITPLLPLMLLVILDSFRWRRVEGNAGECSSIGAIDVLGSKRLKPAESKGP